VEELPNAQELRRVELPSEPTPAAAEPQEVQLTLSPS
jgi:hypothetical protein